MDLPLDRRPVALSVGEAAADPLGRAAGRVCSGQPDHLAAALISPHCLRTRAFTSGDAMAAELEYVALPASVKDLVRKQWGEIKAAAK